MKSSVLLARSAAIGTPAGLRALTPPAILSQAVRRPLIGIRWPGMRPLRSSPAANGLLNLAVVESTGDQFPFTPRSAIISQSASLLSIATAGGL
jgi:uncharacterized membrane protein